MKKLLLTTVLSLLSGILVPALVWAGNTKSIAGTPVIELKEVKIEASRFSDMEKSEAKLVEWQKIDGEWTPQMDLQEIVITPQGNRVSSEIKQSPKLYKAVPYGTSLIAEINLDEVEITAPRVEETQGLSADTQAEATTDERVYDMRGSFERLLNYVVRKSVEAARELIPYRGQ